MFKITYFNGNTLWPPPDPLESSSELILYFYSSLLFCLVCTRPSIYCFHFIPLLLFLIYLCITDIPGRSSTSIWRRVCFTLIVSAMRTCYCSASRLS